MVNEDYSQAVRELVEGEAVEEAFFEEEMSKSGIKICPHRGGPCDGWIVDAKGVHHCFVLNRSGGVVCLRICFKGGQGWGMSIFEKLRRQGLLIDFAGGEKNE